MEIYLARFIESFITPPGIFLILILIIWLLSRYRKYMVSKWFYSGSIILFVLFSMPVTSKLLFYFLESHPALTSDQIRQSSAQAIVVLGAGRYKEAPEFKRDTVSDTSLVRLRYAAYLHKITGLPILATGGNPMGRAESKSEAELMQHELEQSFNIKTVWLEGKSKNTWENARFSTAILKEKNISEAFVVTNAWHMPRAVQSFRNSGIKVTPAPTVFRGYLPASLSLPSSLFLPSANAMHNTQQAFHEIIGMFWYKIRY